MIKYLHLLCVLTALLAGTQVQAADSLFKKGEARKLTTMEASIFGPKATSFRYDKRMINAARIAQERARKHSTSRCWRYVKQALLAAGVVDSYPGTAYAKQAGGELTKNFGFTKLRTMDPTRAPIGAVLVYGGPDAGHVEIKTATGYVSDFVAIRPYTNKRPLLGIYIKPNV